MKDIQEVIQLIVQDCELILCKLPSSDLVEERIDINACCVDTIVNTFKVDRSSVNSWDLAIFVRIASAMTSILFTGIHAIQDEEEELYFQYRKDLFEHWTMFCALCFCFFSDIVPPNSSGLLMQKLESCLSALMTKAKGEQLHSNEFLSFIDSKEKLHFEIKSFYSILVCSLDVGNRYRCSSPSVAGQCVQEQRCSLCHDILHVNLTFSLVAIAITRLHRWMKREAGFPLQGQSLSPVNHLVKTPSKNTPRKSLGIRKRSPGSAILSPVNLSVNQFIDEYLEFVSKLRLKNAHLCIPGVSRRLCTCQDDRAKPTAVVDAPRSQTPARDAADDLGTEPLEEEAVYVPDEEVYTPGPSQSSRKERVRLVAEAVVSTVEEAYEDGEGEAEGFDHRRSMLLDQSEAQEMMLAVSNRLREMEQSMETRVRETAATGREALMIGPEEEEDAASLGSDTIRSSHSDESDTWKSVGSDSGEEDEESGRNPSTPSFYLVDALSPVPPAVRRDDPVPESTPSPATVWRSPHPTPTQKPLRVSIPTWESSSRESIVLSPSTPEVKIKLRRQREANELLKLVDNQNSLWTIYFYYARRQQSREGQLRLRKELTRVFARKHGRLSTPRTSLNTADLSFVSLNSNHSSPAGTVAAGSSGSSLARLRESMEPSDDEEEEPTGRSSVWRESLSSGGIAPQESTSPVRLNQEALVEKDVAKVMNALPEIPLPHPIYNNLTADKSTVLYPMMISQLLQDFDLLLSVRKDRGRSSASPAGTGKPPPLLSGLVVEVLLKESLQCSKSYNPAMDNMVITEDSQRIAKRLEDFSIPKEIRHVTSLISYALFQKLLVKIACQLEYQRLVALGLRATPAEEETKKSKTPINVRSRHALKTIVEQCGSGGGPEGAGAGEDQEASSVITVDVFYAVKALLLRMNANKERCKVISNASSMRPYFIFEIAEKLTKEELKHVKDRRVTLG